MHAPTAVIHPEARIGQGVTIDPFAYIERDVVIGDGCHIYPHAVILNGARIGRDCRIFPGAVISGIPQDLKLATAPPSANVSPSTVAPPRKAALWWAVTA